MSFKPQQKLRVCLDSRLIKRGEYFVSVKGPTFDGHQFIPDVLKRGAAGVIEEAELYRLAAQKLEKVRPRIIGVAGSVGKSTARAFLAQILSLKYRVLEGDLNTKLGLAATFINQLTDHDVIVAELGIDSLGEMQAVVDYLKPDFTLITKLEKEHLQFLKSFKNVVSENLIAVTRSRRRLGYLNLADRRLIEKFHPRADIRYYPLPHTLLEIKKATAGLNLPSHDHDYLSGIYRLATEQFGYTDRDFFKALINLKRPKGRLNLIQGRGGSLILDDSYNAVCDQSVIRGIAYALALAEKERRRLTIILSPMRENGRTEKLQHETVARHLNALPARHRLIIVSDTDGLYRKHLYRPYRHIKSPTDISHKLSEKDLFYIKGSQFYRLEKAVYFLMEGKGRAAELLVRQDARWLKKV